MGQSFTILGQEISFDERQLAFVELRNSFKTLEDELLSILRSNIASAISDFETLPKYLSDAVSLCIQKCATLGVDKLCEHGIYEVDERQFRRELLARGEEIALFAPIDAIGEVADRIDGIERPRGGGLVGGGFGVEGALSGMAIAGAANFLSDGLSSISAMSDRRGARKSASSVLKKPGNTRQILAVYEGIFDLALWETAEQISSFNSDLLDFPSRETKSQAQALTENLAKGRVSEERKSEVMLSALRKNPYDSAAHVLLHSLFGSEGESEEFSSLLGIDFRELAGSGDVEKIIGKVAEGHKYWRDELLQILGRFAGEGFHVAPHIPARKLSGARAEYLKNKLCLPDGLSGHELTDIGEPLALIDTSLFGGGGVGITFTTTGFAVKEAFAEPVGASWTALQSLRGNLENTLFGIRFFGSEINFTGLDIQKQDFRTMMLAVKSSLEKRGWKL